MRITNLTNDAIQKNYEKIERITSRKRYPNPRAAFHQGWNAAIRFVKRVEDAHAVCEQCGKLILGYDDLIFDEACIPFCAKCYDKLFSKGGNQ